MRRVALPLLLVCCLVSACSMMPKTAAELVEAPPDLVEVFRYDVPLPVKTTYRNMLAKARDCWQQSGGFPFTTTFFVDADAFDDDTGFARISLRHSAMVLSVVTLKPVGPTATGMEARRIKMHAGSQVGYADFPFLMDWATGKPVECKSKLIF